MTSGKEILLIGGGHSNIQILKSLANLKKKKFRVTLISDVPLSLYSGMIPSYMAGVYAFNQLHFDLERICHRYGFRFIESAVAFIDAKKNQVLTMAGETFSYDIAVLNIGIKPTMVTTTNSDENVIYLKPISHLLTAWEKIKNNKNAEELFNVTIIGGGAAAFEVAVACRRQFSDLRNSIRIITGQHALLNTQNKTTRTSALNSLRDHNVEVIENKRVEQIDTDFITLDDKTKLRRQICLIATSAEAPVLFRNSKLPINQEGFVSVDKYLRVLGFQNLFAAGDCADFTTQALPKAGVFAVRQGPIIYKNILNLIEEKKKLAAYKPQKNFLTILVSGTSVAIASYRHFSFQGKLAWKLKDFIDRRFMARFQ